MKHQIPPDQIYCREIVCKKCNLTVNTDVPHDKCPKCKSTELKEIVITKPEVKP